VRTRPTDDATAIALAVALHLGLAALFWFAMRPSDAVQASAGGIAADVVEVGDLSAAMRRTLRDRPEPVEEPVEEPLPEPLPDEPEPQPEVPPIPQPEPQAPLPKPEPVEQEEVVDAPTPVKATETKVQEKKNRQRQADLDRIAEAQARARADAKAKADAQAKEAEQKRLAAEREKQLAELRQRRAAASRAAIAAEQRLSQLTAPRSGGSPTPGPGTPSAGAGDDALLGRYAAALQEAIRSKWTRPDNVQSGALCVLEIRQLPGGEVIDVSVGSPCVFDEQGQRSIEAAVLKAQPLPYAGFEKVFTRNLKVRFRAP